MEKKWALAVLLSFNLQRKYPEYFSSYWLYHNLYLEIQRSGKCFCGQKTLKCFKIVPKHCWSSLPIGKYLFDGGAIQGEKIDFALLEGEHWMGGGHQVPVFLHNIFDWLGMIG